MRVAPASLQLEGYYVRELHCSVKPKLEEAGISDLAVTPGLHIQPLKAMQGAPFEVDMSVESGQHKTDPARFRVVLNIASSDDQRRKHQVPYKFNVSLVGFFRLEGIKPTPSIESAVARNAVVILYSSARELLASVSGRGPFPAIVLPTVSFVDDDQTAKAIPPKTATKKKTSRVSRKK